MSSSNSQFLKRKRTNNVKDEPESSSNKKEQKEPDLEAMLKDLIESRRKTSALNNINQTNSKKNKSQMGSNVKKSLAKNISKSNRINNNLNISQPNICGNPVNNITINNNFILNNPCSQCLSLNNNNNINENNNKQADSQEILFLKSLSIILEGKDTCVGCAYIKNGKTVFITSNKFGENPTKKLDPNHRGQEFFMRQAIECLIGGEIDLNIKETFLPLLEILIQNLVFITTKDEKYFYDYDKKENLLIYLHFFFLKQWPPRSIRQILNVGPVLKYKKCQNKINRFVEAIDNILKSDFYLERIKTKQVKLEIVRSSESGVHAEMKLIDYLVKKKFLKLQENGPKYKSIDIYVIASRKPCKNCRQVMETLRSNYSDCDIIYLKNVNTLNNYRFKQPSFFYSKKFEFLSGLANLLSQSSFKSLNKSFDESPQQIIIRSISDKKSNLVSDDNHSLNDNTDHERVEKLPKSAYPVLLKFLEQLLKNDFSLVPIIENFMVELKKRESYTSSFV